MRNYLRLWREFSVDEGEETRENPLTKWSRFFPGANSLGGPVFDMASSVGSTADTSVKTTALKPCGNVFEVRRREYKIVPLVHERMDRLDEFMPQLPTLAVIWTWKPPP